MLKVLILFSFFMLLALISWNDCRWRKISDRMVFWLLITGIAAQLFLHEPGIVSGMMGALVGSLPLLLIAMACRGAFGGGDIKLMAAAGIFLGAKLAAVALALGFCSGGVYGLLCLLMKKKKRKDRFAFGPFLCLGIVGAYFFGEEIWRFCWK